MQACLKGELYCASIRAAMNANLALQQLEIICEDKNYLSETDNKNTSKNLSIPTSKLDLNSQVIDFYQEPFFKNYFVYKILSHSNSWLLMWSIFQAGLGLKINH